jgi:hypothetical protein
MLPSLSARWSLSDAQSGSLIFAEFFSSMFGMLLSGWCNGAAIARRSSWGCF